jgi:hypothetical protein
VHPGLLASGEKARVELMPRLSAFSGIAISIHWSDHDPAHAG